MIRVGLAIYIANVSNDSELGVKWIKLDMGRT